MISARVSSLTIGLVLGGAILLAVLNQFTPDASALHVPTYVVSLAGKYLSFAMLALAGALDNVSVVVRGTLVQLLTPDHMRGRVSAVNSVFIPG